MNIEDWNFEEYEKEKKEFEKLKQAERLKREGNGSALSRG